MYVYIKNMAMRVDAKSEIGDLCDATHLVFSRREFSYLEAHSTS